jgi:arginine-tRNA-protein transferase
MFHFEDQYNCGYLADRVTKMEYLVSPIQIPPEMMDELLNLGWRKFGNMFFRPKCEDCRACIPLRVCAQEFTPSKKQRALLRKNHQISVKFGPLQFREEIYVMYLDHCTRFPERAPMGRDQFLRDFYAPACSGLQSEYYLEDRLLAVGFLDVAANGLSSVYFIYNTAFESLRLGTFSILQEIAYTRQLGLRYYYLGYYIAECSRMEYKGHFHPHERLNWESMCWEKELIE